MTWATGLAIGETAWVVWLCVFIVLERRSPAATLAWIFALAWLPVAGIALYFLVGPRRLKRKKLRYRRSKARLAEALRNVRGSNKDDAAYALQTEHWRPLMTLVQRADQTSPVRADGIEFFTSGDEIFAAMEAAITAARHHVHLEFYIWARDAVGIRFGDLLAAKAREGVEVRLLIDAIGSAWLGRPFIRRLREAGVQVALFNPMSLARFRPDLVNFRTHRKILVCDGTVGFTGGVNIWHVQSAAICGPLAWRDTHMRIDGPPVGDLQHAFFADWDFAAGSAPSSPDYFPQADAEASGPWVQILASGPDTDHRAIEKFCFSAIAAARQRVLITTPYFVPSEPLLAALTSASLRGVKVELLLPARSDHWLVAAASRSYYEELVHSGVQIFEFGPNMIHAKTMVVDDDIALVGTANMDNRSFRLNFEIAAAIYDTDAAGRLAEIFQSDLGHATKFRLREARHENWARKLIESTARLFSPML